MRRREFIAGTAAAVVLSSAARVQQAEAMRRVGILVAEVAEDDPYYEGRLAGLRQGLRDLGWIEGQNINLDIHRANPKAADIRQHVGALLAGQPEVVVTSGGTTTAPMLQATSTVPVVFMAAVDPVGGGFVESLSHPGGNATGFMQFDYSLSAKWLEILIAGRAACRSAGAGADQI
jgi:putative ABC transport system substrate-binding protein